jgi:hypothetical protein
VRFLGADTGRARSDGAQGSSGSRIVVFAERIELIQMTVWSPKRVSQRRGVEDGQEEATREWRGYRVSAQE